MASAKIKHTKIMRIINNNAVRGRFSKIYLTRKFIARNICDAEYSRFTVHHTQQPTHANYMSIHLINSPALSGLKVMWTMYWSEAWGLEGKR